MPFVAWEIQSDLSLGVNNWRPLYTRKKLKVKRPKITNITIWLFSRGVHMAGYLAKSDFCQLDCEFSFLQFYIKTFQLQPCEEGILPPLRKRASGRGRSSLPAEPGARSRKSCGMGGKCICSQQSQIHSRPQDYWYLPHQQSQVMTSVFF